MTTADLQRDLSRERREVDNCLRRLLRAEKGIPTRLRRAMAHSLLAAGKRLRPILVLWVWDAMRPPRVAPPIDRSGTMAIACALEMLHTYSLIHDDLPAMDDDALRRGQPTCHVAFDEATAILAGDGLQALAFSLLARHGGPVAGRLMSVIADAVGPAGMVGGQILDLAAEQSEVGVAAVTRIHTGKTARMLMAAAGAGGIAAGASQARVETLMSAVKDLGLAFQGADDVLDVTASGGDLGKTPGKDVASGKATWVRVEGMTKALQRTQRLGRRGSRLLTEALPPSDARERVLALADLLWQRSN